MKDELLLPFSSGMLKSMIGSANVYIPRSELISWAIYLSGSETKGTGSGGKSSCRRDIECDKNITRACNRGSKIRRLLSAIAKECEWAEFHSFPSC